MHRFYEVSGTTSENIMIEDSGAAGDIVSAVKHDETAKHRAD